ncbi:uncharacterized protein LOC143116858 [Alosa pseudoharengus]|uniref:uncharacterized protein LOC143116858 n=1 Tax=Alosa pseudoharengus TaxID=34774 RepID=UPI003F8A1A7F
MNRRFTTALDRIHPDCENEMHHKQEAVIAGGSIVPGQQSPEDGLLESTSAETPQPETSRSVEDPSGLVTIPEPTTPLQRPARDPPRRLADVVDWGKGSNVLIVVDCTRAQCCFSVLLFRTRQDAIQQQLDTLTDWEMTQTPQVLSLLTSIIISVSMVTVSTAPCVFPFRYGVLEYRDCTTVDSPNGPWCATTNNYHRDEKWRYCREVPKWSVTYSSTHICALEGSSVTISCSYTYPSYLTVKGVFWTNQYSVHSDLSKNEIYKQRVTMDSKNKHRECSLNMTQLTKADEQYQYYCRITTNVDKQKITGKPGIYLKITDLQIDSSSQKGVKEGDHVTLTCKTTCTLTGSPSFIWSKDGRPVEKKQITNNQLQLHPVSYEDEGSYTCAVGGHEGLPSTPYRLNVKYSPKNTRVESDPSGEIPDGANVTLTCMSEADPPVHTYTWIKKSGAVELESGKENTLTFSQIHSEDSGEYLCRAANRIGHQDSPAMFIKVSSMVQTMLIAVLVGVALSAVVGLFCIICRLRRSKQLATNNNRTSGEDNQDENHGNNMQMNLNHNTTQPDAVYQTLNPNTTQPDAVYQSLNPNITQPDAVYHTLNPKSHKH